MSRRHRYLKIVGAISAGVVCVCVAGAEASQPAARTADAVSSLSLEDPVVEEPLRPLFPGEDSAIVSEPAGCGRMGSAAVPVGLLLTQIMRFVPGPNRFRLSLRSRGTA